MKKKDKIDLALGAIFVLYGIISLQIRFRYDTEFNAPYLFVFKYLTLPWLIVVAILFIKFKVKFIEIIGTKPRTYFIVVIMVAYLTFFSVGYVLFLNTIIPPQTDILYSGKIKDKIISGSRSVSYVIELDTLNDEGEPIKLTMSEYEYNELSVGNYYERKLKKGGLGIIYKKL